MINKRIKLVDMVVPQTLAAGTTYNGAADASGVGIDVRDYDECMVVLNVGTVPSNGTLDVTISESDDNTALASASTAITGAVFDQVDADNDESTFVGQVNLKVRKRYLYVKAVVANQSIPVSVNGFAIGNSFPIDNADSFEA